MFDLLEYHLRCELVELNFAHLHEASVNLAHPRVSTCEVCLIEILGHFEGFVDFILDL